MGRKLKAWKYPARLNSPSGMTLEIYLLLVVWVILKIIIDRKEKFPNSHHCSWELQQVNMVYPGDTKLHPEREKRS